MGQAGNEGIPELLDGDLSSSTLQHVLATMGTTGPAISMAQSAAGGRPQHTTKKRMPRRARTVAVSQGITGRRAALFP